MTPTPDAPELRFVATDVGDSTRLLGGSVRLLDLPSFRDHRGVLTPITFDDVGFSAARAFVVNAPLGAVRGGHAHLHVRQILFRASGTIGVDLRHRGASARLTLDGNRPAVLLEAGVWARQTYIAPESTLIVFADGPYDPAEYSADENSAEVTDS